MDELDDLDEFRPRTWGRPMGRSMAVFSAIHGAYHVLSQRMRLETADVGLSPSEAVVLATLLDAPRLTISVVRQRTGLRASTLDSLVDRLVERGRLRRVSPRAVSREVTLEMLPGGEVDARRAASALAEVDAELRVFLNAETLGGGEAIFEAARALGVPGTAADA
jgi:DNA-binding MarR family transcriptional regulator